MKKITSITLALILILTMTTACGANNNEAKSPPVTGSSSTTQAGVMTPGSEGTNTNPGGASAETRPPGSEGTNTSPGSTPAETTSPAETTTPGNETANAAPDTTPTEATKPGSEGTNAASGSTPNEATTPGSGGTNPTPGSTPAEATKPGSNVTNPTPSNTSPTAPASAGASTVFMTADISPKGLQAVYKALGIAPTGNDKVAIKVSTGEPPNSNYLRQDLIGDFVKGLNGTYVECNTAYGGRRASIDLHYQVAKDHGFEPIVLMDDEGDMEIPITGGLQLKIDRVGKKIADFNFHVVLSHFKGHQMAGFGGALKQLSIGYGSSSGKSLIHTGGSSTTGIRGGSQNEFLASMADASKGVVNYIKSMTGGQIIYINVMNRLSIDCDCNGNPSEPDIHDIGILASTDPVALDQACLDLIYKAEGNERFVRRVEAQNGVHVIEAAAQIGLGNREYTLKSINV
ncbi:hypothetical protein FACS1894127_5260 [Clostridia bacterium]|nr:hypothetical protein FACS1894127_5260 [Clostridia bacterium]